jgi:septum formation protein
MVSRLASAKAAALVDAHKDCLIIGSDQTAVLNGQKLGKPGNCANALAQLCAASGQTVVFYTGVCVLNAATGESLGAVDRTVAQFRVLSETQIASYVAQEPAFDCAGGFKSEGLGIALFEKIETQDPNALVGLPLILLVGLLERFGVAVL